jgi:hypothetical protein
MPLLDVGERLNTPAARIDLAADLIGAMAHPKDKTGRRRRRSALAETLLGMSDRDDELEARLQVKDWFRRAGSFTTASESDPYSKQQTAMLQQIPKMLTVGLALDLVWAMDVHHLGLPGGASLNKALAILQHPICGFPTSERGLRTAWSRYKPVVHLCAAFRFAFEEARRKGAPDELDERMKCAYHEGLEETLSIAATYQRFGAGFMPQGQRRPLLDPEEIWLLRGIEAHESFVPEPLAPEVLAVAEAYEAPRNVAYR